MITYHEIFQDEAAALAFVKMIYLHYNPLGYGTSLTVKQQPDGTWLVTGSRAASCD